MGLVGLDDSGKNPNEVALAFELVASTCNGEFKANGSFTSSPVLVSLGSSAVRAVAAAVLVTFTVMVVP
jgi:hypothetical protein